MENLEVCNLCDHLMYIDGGFQSIRERLVSFYATIRSELQVYDRNWNGLFRNLSNRFPKLIHFGMKMGSMMDSTDLCDSADLITNFIKSKHKSSVSEKSLLHAMRLATMLTLISIGLSKIN